MIVQQLNEGDFYLNYYIKNKCLFAGSSLSGWIPVYDTMHGIRGEVNVTVKVELFSDFNKFRQSSCGVQFFCCEYKLFLVIFSDY